MYIGADNKLYSDGKVVSTGDHTHNYAGATSPGGPALKVDLNPSGLLDATYGSYGGILQDSNKGPVSGSWSNRIKILHNNSTGYYTELAQNFTGTAGLWHRRNVAGTVSEWTPVIDNANFHTYLDSTYVIRGNDPNVLTNYVRYSIASGLTMNWEWGNATPTHIWGAKASDSSKAYVFNGDNIRAFANAVNRAGDTMTGTLKVTEIQATNGNGLVMWNGTTYTYLGMQAGTTYIRSGETDLQHRYNGTDYKIWDARNLVGLRTEHSHNTINFIDSRETASTPQEHAAGVWLDFKANAKANLSDGGNYTGLLTVRKYGGTTDWSGGKSAQLGFTDNSNVWVRFGTGTSWEAWKQLATTGWADGKFLPLAGGTVTGNIILKGSTNADMTNANIHPRLRFDNSNSSQTVSFIFTDYDSYRAPAGIKLVGNQGNEWFEAPKLIKTGSSDSYVLLGGGGHKALAQFVYAAGNLGVQESTGTSDNISRAQFWRDNNLGAYGVTLSHSDNAGYKTKIYHDYGSGGNLYMKACSNGTWGSVYTIWNSGNFDPNTKVNKAGDTMTGPLVIASTVNNQYNEGLRISLAANNWAGITFGSSGTSGAPSNGWFAARNPSNQFIISPGDSSSSTGLTLNKGGNLLWRNRDVLLKDEINSQVGGSKSAQMNWASWGTDNYGGAIQIREKGLVTNTQSAWGYSPALSFHWGNRYAKRFGMRYDGQFAVDDVPISLSTHNHNSLYVTALGTNGNYLTWTKNGTTNNITVPYSTNSDNSDKLDGLQGGRNGGYVLSKTLGTIPDYGYAVVGLINLTNPSSNPSQQNLSIGEFGVYRPNAVGGFNNTVTFAIQRQHNSTSMVGTYYWVGSADYMKPVTFTYGGVKYGGFAVRLQAANGVIRMQLRYGDIEPFMVTYKTVNNGTTVNNSEINNSLVEVSTLDNKINAVVSKLGTATIGSATLPVYLNSGTITQCTASSIFSNLSNSGNNISITIAGQNRTLTPAYATSAGTASNSNALGGYSLGTSNTSGTWGKVPLVKSDGVIEIGRYIDMHYTNTSTKDYGTRIQISSDAGNVLTLPTSSGTLCLTNHSHSEYYSSNISRSANTVLAAPNKSSGSATFRKLVAADIPALDYMSKKGGYSQPIVLAAGYVYRSSGSSSSWSFSGSKVSAISSVSCSVSGGVMTITFNPSSGHSVYCYAACANMATSGDMPSYTGNYRGRSGGAEWMGTYCSGGSSIWMRQMAQSNADNDSWHSDNMNKSDGPLRITLIVCGYHS